MRLNGNLFVCFCFWNGGGGGVCLLSCVCVFCSWFWFVFGLFWLKEANLYMYVCISIYLHLC